MWCLGLIVAYCFAAPAGGGIDSFCEVAAPIYWSAKDTRATKSAIDRHNRQWEAVCGGAAKRQ